MVSNIDFLRKKIAFKNFPEDILSLKENLFLDYNFPNYHTHKFTLIYGKKIFLNGKRINWFRASE